MRSRCDGFATHQVGLAAMIILAGLLLFYSQSVATMRRQADSGSTGSGSPKASSALPDAQQRVHRLGKVNMCVTNWGILGSQGRSLYESRDGCFMSDPAWEVPDAPSYEYPAGSGIEYLWHAGIWIGAVVNDTPFVSVGLDGWQWIYELWPDAQPLGAIEELTACEGSECYSPDAVSEQDIIAVFADTSADIPLSWQQQDPWDNRKHRPLDVKVTRKSYSWSGEGYNDFIIAEYTIEYIGANSLSQVYIGLFVDPDIYHVDESPYGVYGAQDDLTGFRPVTTDGSDTVNIAWAADNDGSNKEPVFTEKSPRGVIGVTVLDPPEPGMDHSYNWWTSSSSGYPYDWGPWRRESLERWREFNICYPEVQNTFPDNVMGTPGGDCSKYFVLSNKEFDYDQIFSCTAPGENPDWLDANPQCYKIANGEEIKFLLSWGPFDTLAPGDTVHFVVAFVAGEDFHVDPQNLARDPNMSDPWRFYANLNFTDLETNALKAKAVYQSGYTAVTPPKPVDMEIHTGEDTTRLFLSWTKITRAEVSKYDIYRSTQSGVYHSPLSSVAQPATDSVAFVDSNLTPGQRYYYVIKSVNSYGQSGVSNEVSAVPAAPLVAPQSIRASDVGDGSTVRLQWTMLPEQMLYGFLIYYGVSSGDYTHSVDVRYVFDYDVSGLTEGQTYYFALRGYGRNQAEGYLSDEAWCTPNSVPATPTNLNVRAGDGAIKLWWSRNSELDLAGYRVYRSTPDSLHFELFDALPLTDDWYSDATVANGVNYFYGISAVDQDSNESDRLISDRITPGSSEIGNIYCWILDKAYGWGNGDGTANPGEAVSLYLWIENSGSSWVNNPRAVISADDPYVMAIYKETDTLECGGDIRPGGWAFLSSVLRDYSEARYGGWYVLVISSDCPSGHEIQLPVDFYDERWNFSGTDTISFMVASSDLTPPRALDVRCCPRVSTSGTDTIFALIEDGAEIEEAYADIYDGSDNSLVKSIDLNDEGTSADQVAGDRVFSGVYEDTLKGEFYVNVTATDSYDNSYTSMKVAGFCTAPLDTSTQILLYHRYGGSPYCWWSLNNECGVLPSTRHSKNDYLQTLDSLSRTYVVWDAFYRGEITAAALGSFAHKTVIFVDDFGDLSSTTQSQLSDLLSSGGRLLISSQEMGSYLGGTDFYKEYLSAEYVGLRHCEGVVSIPGNPLASGFFSEFPPLAEMAEEIDPLPPATAALKYYGDPSYVPSSSGTAAASLDNGLYKLVHTAFCLDALRDADRQLFLGNILAWLDASSEAVPRLNISLFQNSVLTKYLELLINSSVELEGPPSAQIRAGSNAADTILLAELAPQTYQGSYTLTSSGTCSLFVSVLSDFEVAKDTIRLFDVQLIEPQSGGSLFSHDGRLQLTVPFGCVTESTYFVCIPLPEEEEGGSSEIEFLGSAYQIGPAKRSFGDDVTLVFSLDDFDLIDEEKPKICVYRQKRDDWVACDGYLNFGRTAVTVRVNELGIYRLGFAQPEPQTSVPRRYELFHNYPNPFNPNTILKYNLCDAGNVKLIIYNVLGQKVKTLVDEYQDAGSKSVMWDGKDEKQREVASGIYFYRMEVDDRYAAVKKMVLIK